jgi:hypothetical protein
MIPIASVRPSETTWLDCVCGGETRWSRDSTSSTTAAFNGLDDASTSDKPSSENRKLIAITSVFEPHDSDQAGW